MIPPKKVFERENIPVEDFVIGVIEKIDYEKDHEFKSSFGDSVQDAVRLKFKIEGMKFLHPTRWMKFNYHKKSNLYKKYLVALVEGMKEYGDYDIMRLQGMKVKMLWKNDDEEGNFQSLDTIRPADKKLPYIEGLIPVPPVLEGSNVEGEEAEAEKVPF